MDSERQNFSPRTPPSYTHLCFFHIQITEGNLFSKTFNGIEPIYNPFVFVTFNDYYETLCNYKGGRPVDRTCLLPFEKGGPHTWVGKSLNI